MDHKKKKVNSNTNIQQNKKNSSDQMYVAPLFPLLFKILSKNPILDFSIILHTISVKTFEIKKATQDTPVMIRKFSSTALSISFYFSIISFSINLTLLI